MCNLINLLLFESEVLARIYLRGVLDVDTLEEFSVIYQKGGSIFTSAQSIFKNMKIKKMYIFLLCFVCLCVFCNFTFIFTRFFNCIITMRMKKTKIDSKPTKKSKQTNKQTNKNKQTNYQTNKQANTKGDQVADVRICKGPNDRGWNSEGRNSRGRSGHKPLNCQTHNQYTHVF